MFGVRNKSAALFAALTLLVASAAPASAQDADAAAISAYKLTETGLAKYSEATKRLSALPNACEQEEADNASDSKSLNELVAQIDTTPGAKAAIQSAGLTSREYVLFSMSLLQNAMAGWAVSQPGGKLPPGVSQANVDFVKQHEADIQGIAQATEGRCADESAGEETEG
jgi:hypothetical protein